MSSNKSCKVFLTDGRVVQALLPAKCKRQIISSLVVVFLLASNAQAQAGDWQALQHLRPGTRITVKTRHRARCFFTMATDDELVCKPPRLLWLGPAERRFDRQSVREVRLESSDEANGAVGAAIGAGAGAALGASNGNGTLTRGGGAFLIGSIGALCGWFFGSDFHILHGKIIYKR